MAKKIESGPEMNAASMHRIFPFSFLMIRGFFDSVLCFSLSLAPSQK